MFFDMPLEELETYTPPRQEAPDFDAFWQASIAETRRHPLDARFEPVDYGLRAQETYDVTFTGYNGQPVKGWLLLPRQRQGRCLAWWSTSATAAGVASPPTGCCGAASATPTW